MEEIKPTQASNYLNQTSTGVLSMITPGQPVSVDQGAVPFRCEFESTRETYR